MQVLTKEHIPQLCECFKSVQSNNTQLRKNAETTLEQLSLYHNFCSCLAELIADRGNEQSVRWMAAVHFKNTTQKYWKKQGAHHILDDEKAHLRQRLLDLLREEDGQIAVQLCIALAKIARMDFPKEWPELVDVLAAKLQSSTDDMLGMRRTYLSLHHVLKELASKRLRPDVRVFEQLTQAIIPVIWERWCLESRHMMEGLPPALSNPMQAQQFKFWFERWLLLLKILKRLVTSGLPSDASTLEDSPIVSEVMTAVMESLRVLLSLRPPQQDMRNQLHAMLDRGLLKLAKFMREAVKQHPWSVRLNSLLKTALEFFGTQVVQVSQTPTGAPSFPEFRIQAMLFIHKVLTCPSYKLSSEDPSQSLPSLRSGLYNPPPGTEGRIKQLEYEVHTLGGLGDFLQVPVLASLMTAVMEKYFPLTAAEIEEMESDPETFHHDCDSSSFEDQLRPCAETFFLTILEQNREGLAPTVADLLSKMITACPPGTAARPDLPKIGGVPVPVLLKEAVYNAVGHGSYELHDHVDFEPWFRSDLLPEVLDPSPAATVLRRRAAIVIGQWVAKMPDSCRPPAYDALVKLLHCTDHVALQLAALQALRLLIDDWGFYEDQFHPFIDRTLTAVLQMLPGIDQLDTQVQIFSFISLITERMAEGIKPYAPLLLQAIPSVWQLGDDQPLLRVQVLNTLAKLLNALGPESPVSYPIVGPILRAVTDPDAPDELNQLEDGLALWLVTLRNAPHFEPGLLEPFPNLVKVFERSTEHVRVGMQIITSCVMLGGAQFLQHFGGAVVQILAENIGALNEKGLGVLLPVMELLVQCFPAEAPPSMQTALIKLIELVLNGRESSLTLSAAFRVLSRVVLQNGPFWAHLLQAAAAQHAPSPVPPESLLCAILDVWTERFDTLAQPHVRRQNALALAACLATPIGGMAERAAGLLKVIVRVWEEEMSLSDATDLMHFRTLDYDAENEAVVQSSEAQGEFERRTRLTDSDPLLQFELGPFLSQRLGEATQHPQTGPMMVNALNALDPALQTGLKRAMEEKKPGM